MSELAGLYARHAADVFRSANAVLRDAALAEDVVQDVFERLLRTKGYDARRGPVGPYLRMMARSRALDVWRSARAGDRAQHRLEEHATGVSTGDDPATVLVDEMDRRSARAAVHRLPAEQRQAIGLVYWGGLTVQQLATAEGLPLGTAKSRIRLGLGRLARDSALA